MKKKLYLVALMLLLASVFTAPAFAHKKESGDPTPPTTTALPINNAVWYLAIAGLVIGSAAVYKFRSARTVKA